MSADTFSCVVSSVDFHCRILIKRPVRSFLALTGHLQFVTIGYDENRHGTAYYLSAYSFLWNCPFAGQRCIAPMPTGSRRAGAYVARTCSRGVLGSLRRRNRARHVSGTGTPAVPGFARGSTGHLTLESCTQPVARLCPALCSGLRADPTRLVVSGSHRHHPP